MSDMIRWHSSFLPIQVTCLRFWGRLVWARPEWKFEFTFTDTSSHLTGNFVRLIQSLWQPTLPRFATLLPWCCLLVKTSSAKITDLKTLKLTLFTNLQTCWLQFCLVLQLSPTALISTWIFKCEAWRVPSDAMSYRVRLCGREDHERYRLLVTIQ